MTHYLQLGRLVDLSLAEIENLLPGKTLASLTSEIVQLDVEQAELLEKLQASGGVIKALEQVEVIDNATQEQIIDRITTFLATKTRPTFSVHEINRPNQQRVISLQNIKNKLKERNVSSRFIDSTASGLSASVLLHQNVEEITVVYQENQTVLARTIWVQDIDDWTIRDRQKPERDPKRGMLPPKLARMMINFVSSDIQNASTKRLLDPFCGSGTVLMEGMMTGWQVIGSDLSPEAVQDSAANMHWFSQKYNQPENYTLFIADAATVNISQLGKKVDAIVTEPFLGKPKPNSRELPNIFKGLEKMYWGCLKNWTKILQDGGEIVIVTPLVNDRKTTYSLESIIDKSKTLGYNVVSGPLLYSRPQTTVQRAIYKLKYKQ